MFQTTNQVMVGSKDSRADPKWVTVGQTARDTARIFPGLLFCDVLTRPLWRAVCSCSFEGCCPAGERLPGAQWCSRKTLLGCATTYNQMLKPQHWRHIDVLRLQSSLMVWWDTECIALHHPSQSKFLTPRLLWSVCPANIQARWCPIAG